MPLVLDLPAGLTGVAELVVGEQHTAPRIGSGRIRVLATPVMINLIEAAALAAVEQSLPEEHQSLGSFRASREPVRGSAGGLLEARHPGDADWEQV